MKYEWRKKEKQFYLPKNLPEMQTIKAANFFTIKGEGDPNKAPFSDKVAALYAISYAIRMMPKNGFTPKGYFEYTVFPLEGIWSFKDGITDLDDFSKDNFIYEIMIKQPDFVDDNLFNIAKDATLKKKADNPFIKDVKLKSFNEKNVVQMMHIGPFDTEKQSFDKMSEYIKENNLTRVGYDHKEIYISNLKRTQPEKLKTVLRYMIK